MVVRIDYPDFSGLDAIYLEDSFVLDIHVAQDAVIFFLDAVLTEQHPAYSLPFSDEQYCYLKMNLIFADVTYAKWIKKIMRPSADKSGEIDYGNIDLLFLEDGHYHIEGDWGELDIMSSPPTVESLT